MNPASWAAGSRSLSTGEAQKQLLRARLARCTDRLRQQLADQRLVAAAVHEVVDLPRLSGRRDTAPPPARAASGASRSPRPNAACRRPGAGHAGRSASAASPACPGALAARPDSHSSKSYRALPAPAGPSAGGILHQQPLLLDRTRPLRHVNKVPVQPVVVCQLGMECRHHQVPLARRHDASVFQRCHHLHAGLRFCDQRRPDEDRS